MRAETVTQKLQQGIRHHEAGELQQAETCYREVLAAHPEHPRALYLLGSLAHQQGGHEEAVTLLERALQQAPDNIACLFNLGNALRALERLDEALARFRRVITLSPLSLDAWCNLGEALRAKGDTGEAVAAYEHALTLDGDFPAALMNLANIHLAAGRYAAAAPLYQRLLRHHPEQAGAWINLGEACRLQGRLVDACRAFRQALSLQPALNGIWQCLGELYVQLEHLDEAAGAFRKALESEGERADLWFKLGHVEELRGQMDEALAAYRHVRQRQPDNADAHYVLGNALAGLGRFEEAVDMFHTALRCNPALTAVYYALTQIRSYRFSASEVQQMEALHRQNTLSDEQREFLDFALCRALEQEQRYDDAFHFLAEGNRLARKQYHYDSAGMEAFFRDIRAVFDRDFFERRSEFGIVDKTPIFIVGMMRSGTSLVEQILASHPQVCGAGELTDLKQIIYYAGGDLNTQAYPAQAPDLDAGQVQARAREYLSRLAARTGGAERVTDKMPGNFRYLGMIRLMFPHARVIHCRRHPLDTCLSCYRLHFSGTHPYAYDLRELGHYYGLYAGLMAHWRTVLPGYIHDIQYESLVVDQEAEVRRLLDFCGLPWHPACLDFHKTERAVITASQSQVRAPLYRSALQTWKAYEPHLGPLIEALGDVLPEVPAPSPTG
ncbi:MAG: tetratricopeptide repeat protein [Gammaproteobacteria bacterium]